MGWGAVINLGIELVDKMTAGARTATGGTTTARGRTATGGTTTAMGNTISAYNAEFNQPKHIQNKMFLAERNVMRSPSEGKANLDRYRLASARIFGLIDDTLSDLLLVTSSSSTSGEDNNNGGDKKSGYVLERASIDELFIDVTEFCYGILERESRKKEECCDEKINGRVMNDRCSQSNDDDDDGTKEETADNDTKQVKREEFQKNCLADSITSLKESVICHQNRIPPSHIQQHDTGDDDDDDDGALALRIGCHIAHTIRRIVFQTLGFTLSSGISTSKLVAKLAASYGKPNGQAVIYPEAIPYVMDETEIRKARMLGGKLGKKVQSLLPPEAADTDKKKPTLGCVARLLTLDDLVVGLGEENGRWVFDACRGIEHEEVRSTLKVLPKSITAFKSFPKVSYPELEKWTTLLARDVMKRVQLDNARNHRIPRAVTVGYTMKPGGSWIGKTFRLPFPTDREFDSRVQRLEQNTRKILTERGEKSFIRIGFSAIDFVARPKSGIDSFFAAAPQQEKNTIPSKRQGDNNNNSEDANTESTRARLNARLKHDQQQKEENSLQGWLTKVDDADVSKKAVVEETETSSPHRSTNLKQPSRTSDEAESVAVEVGTNNTTTATIGEEISDEELARRLQSTYDDEARENSNNLHHNVVGEESNNNNVTGDRAIGLQFQSTINATIDDVDERDRAIALQLQSKYDREHSILSDVERFSGISKRKKGTSPKNHQGGSNKKNRIDNFFSKR